MRTAQKTEKRNTWRYLRQVFLRREMEAIRARFHLK